MSSVDLRFTSPPPLSFPIRLSGVVFVSQRESGFGLSAQEPWIQHATVRDNILFGNDYDPVFYQIVIDACALTDDLNVRLRAPLGHI